MRAAFTSLTGSLKPESKLSHQRRPKENKAHTQRAEEPAKDGCCTQGTFLRKRLCRCAVENAAVAKIERTLGTFKKFPLFFPFVLFYFFLLAIKRNILTTSRICWKAENDRLTLSKQTKPVGFTRSGICLDHSNHLQISSTGQKENHVLAIKPTKLYVSDQPDVRRIKWKTR